MNCRPYFTIHILYSFVEYRHETSLYPHQSKHQYTRSLIVILCDPDKHNNSQRTHHHYHRVLRRRRRSRKLNFFLLIYEPNSLRDSASGFMYSHCSSLARSLHYVLGNNVITFMYWDCGWLGWLPFSMHICQSFNSFAAIWWWWRRRYTAAWSV